LSSAEAMVEVLLPPSVGNLDELKEVYKGSTVSFTAPVSGYGTFNYQWLKNGVNIPGATGNTLVLANVTIPDSGSYSLNVGSEGGALYSNPMNFRVLTDAIELQDNFLESVQLSEANGKYRGASVGATSEADEPPHGDRAASASVWMKWRAPGSGIATFDTKGSNFDTTLAVYTGETFETLQVRAADADLGGYLTSKVRFNAVEGQVYHVAVDGFNGATGDVVLNWQLEVTAAVLPVITVQPQPTTGVVGFSAEFVVSLEVETSDIGYAWYKDGQLLAGETTKRLVFEEVKTSDAGVYAVQVTSGAESIVSDGARLLIQFEEDAPNTEVNTKLDLGSFLTPGPVGGDTGDKEIEIVFGGPDLLPRLIAKLRKIEKKPGEFSFTGATVYNTTGAAKDPGEPNHAGNTGGASAWTTFTPTEEGTAKLSTENSDFDTVLAIYKVGSGSGWDALEEVGSDDNSGEDGQDSEVIFDVEEGVTYFVAVDGAGGETGTVQLNHELSQTPVIDSATESADGLLNGTVTLEVTASNPLADAELSYQWRRDGNLIDGATSATLD
nr:immunoglobulin domain-containing protein [Verrucomicrobiota bacterium]